MFKKKDRSLKLEYFILLQNKWMIWQIINGAREFSVSKTLQFLSFTNGIMIILPCFYTNCLMSFIYYSLKRLHYIFLKCLHCQRKYTNSFYNFLPCLNYTLRFKIFKNPYFYPWIFQDQDIQSRSSYDGSIWIFFAIY